MTPDHAHCTADQSSLMKPPENRSGLSALSYRIGSHQSFFAAMAAALSKGKYPALRRLRTRSSNDPVMAFLDAWATVADVLTFYQERIANEGYLRTAVHRRSIFELAYLVGYKPRPGVAASAFLAYTIEKAHDPVAQPGMESSTPAETVIPAGVRAQTIPEPGELPQTFETIEELHARPDWNDLVPRRTRPQLITECTPVLYFEGTATNLRPNDRLIVVVSRPNSQEPLRVQSVKMEEENKRTKVTLQTRDAEGKVPQTAGLAYAPSKAAPTIELASLLEPLAKRPALHPFGPADLKRSVSTLFNETRGDTAPHIAPHIASHIASHLRRDVGRSLYVAMKNANVTEQSKVEVHAFRVSASPFGHNAPLKPVPNNNGVPVETVEWPLFEASRIKQSKSDESPAEDRTLLALDAVYEQITPGGWVVIERPTHTIITQIESIRKVSKAAYGITGRVTELKLKTEWLLPGDLELSDIRETAIYAQSEVLTLAEEPVMNDVKDSKIELDTVYSGLESGRWLIVEGERTDIAGTSGVKAAELVMLADITQEFDPMLPGDKVHTHLHLSDPLKYSYKRSTVTIHGNVVRASHGETHEEVLGSGDGSKRLQHFVLKQSPLTHVPAPVARGVKSSLEVRVNDVRWHEVESFVNVGQADRAYVVQKDDTDKTSISFGNGVNGAPLPSGSENVKARYRTGIGQGGNVEAHRISLLGDRPLGVKAVINPLPSSGGADSESHLDARRNAPVGVLALDRLVSVQDYADFARTFAAVGKASAVEVFEGTNRLVHVTIAGVDDIPIDDTSELYRNLKLSLSRYGDPYLPIHIDSREVMFIVIAAKVSIGTDYFWSSVESIIRQTLLAAYSFNCRELGQDVFLSDVISHIQAVEGVEFVDVDVLDKVEEAKISKDRNRMQEDMQRRERITVNLAKRNRQTGVLRPAQLAYLNADIKDTLILTELK